MIVLLGEEVAQDTGGVAAADLVGRQGKVNALHEVPQLGHCILAEHSEWNRDRMSGRVNLTETVLEANPNCTRPRVSSASGQTEAPGGRASRHLPLSDGWQDKEHPEVNSHHQDHLKGQLAQYSLAQVEGTVNDHGAELDQQHEEEGLRHLVI